MTRLISNTTYFLFSEVVAGGGFSLLFMRW